LKPEGGLKLKDLIMVSEAGKRYEVIYADPPWSYDNKKTGGTMGSGASAKYELMTNEDIMNMPIHDIIEKNAVLFLWVTVPLLPEGMAVLTSWGFKYKTMITWRKIMSLGMGYWFRGQCEHLLLGVRGKVKPFRQQVANFYSSDEFDIDECYQSKAGKHSQKPQYFRELIEKATSVSFEHPKKLELFARSRDGLFRNDEYIGWDVYGNQVDNTIKL
jgi:N6-adenosine-specific RNA methylase IME4